ncbi:hypothetical protein ASZ78_013045 [Callipepla squamata]|uniref:Transmembrane protein 79 n=1 Tax=Callipepla squamata TaxID=9009 RepID=A0A226MAJ5_CALSU|nr:hypothetical protein ASZ78_013045 [Callipepla squamata]
MAAADPTPEEVALLELGKAAPPDPPSPNEHRGDPDATLLWDQRQHGARGRPDPADTEQRSSPEGGHDDPEEGTPSHPTAEADGGGVDDPGLPVTAAHVFVPIDPLCIERTPGEPKKQQRSIPQPQEEEEEEGGRGGARVPPRDRTHSIPPKQPFLPAGPSCCRDPLGFEGRAAKPGSGSSRCSCSGAVLKAISSLVGAVLLCPCLIYGAYVFLPFDAPLLPTVSARLLYTLRCAAFATVPIVLGERRGRGHSAAALSPHPAASPPSLFPPTPPGMIVSGISRLCSAALEPFGGLQREVEIHRTFVSQSVHLFVLYFFNMAVLATYLQQEVLKLIPLLTGLFAISR